MSRKTKIGNLEDALVVDKKIGSLHVSVKDALGVQVPQTL